MLYRSSVPADCCTSPGIEPPKAPKCNFATPPGGTAVPEEGAGDAHVVVVGRADIHHQVGGRAQPVPAAKGIASPQRQRVGAHDVPDEGAQGHGVALQQHLAQGSPSVEELVFEQQCRGRCPPPPPPCCRPPGLRQDPGTVPAVWLGLRNSVRRHCEVHLGRAPGVLVAHEAAVQGVVDVVGLGHVRHEVGGRAEL